MTSRSSSTLLVGSAARLRHAKPADIPCLIDLLQVLFAVEEDFNFDERRHQKGLSLMIKDERCCVLVAEIEQRVVGMCTGQLTISTAEGGVALLVEDVVVAEGARRIGLGRRLLTRLEQWAAEKGVSRLQLLADRTNKVADDFYAGLGWQRTRLVCLRKNSSD